MTTAKPAHSTMAHPMPDPVREETGGGGQRFRTRPVVVEARQLGRDYDEDCEIVRWCGGQAVGVEDGYEDALLTIDTLEGVVAACPGDWIIKGVAGEFYPCKRDIFARTYEPAAREFGEGEHLLKLSLDTDRVICELVCVGTCLPPADADGPSNQPCWLRTWADNEDLVGHVEDLHELGTWRISATFDGNCPTVTLHERVEPAPSVFQQEPGERERRLVKALRFYADAENYEDGAPGTWERIGMGEAIAYGGSAGNTEFEFDNGEIARAALKAASISFSQREGDGDA
jgi:hypothetical protein